MNHTIYKDFYLMTSEEQEELRKDYGCDNIYVPTDMDLDEYIKSTFEDDFGKDGNYKYSPLANQKVAVIGELGLWDGKHKIYPKEFENVSKAVYACLEDMNNIYEDRYGNLHIEAHHHDGCNHFIIKKLIDNKLRCLHFRKEVFGC